ncbi:DUF4817 domain-containing protein, partial [Trichonephila clavipes]
LRIHVQHENCPIHLAVDASDYVFGSWESGKENVLQWLLPNFGIKHLKDGQGPPTSLPVPPTSREDLWLDGCLEYPHAAKAFCIYEHPCHLQDSNLEPTAQQSASLTTIPNGRTMLNSETAPVVSTITLLVQRFRDTGSVADRKRSGRASIVKMKVADVETALQRSPWKRLSVYINIITKFISLLKVMKDALSLGCGKTAQCVTHHGTAWKF